MAFWHPYIPHCLVEPSFENQNQAMKAQIESRSSNCKEWQICKNCNKKDKYVKFKKVKHVKLQRTNMWNTNRMRRPSDAVLWVTLGTEVLMICMRTLTPRHWDIELSKLNIEIEN